VATSRCGRQIARPGSCHPAHARHLIAHTTIYVRDKGGSCEGARSQSGDVEQLRELTCQIRPFARTSAMAEVRPGHQSMATGRCPSGTPVCRATCRMFQKGRHLPMACGCERSPADVPHQTVGPRSCRPSECERCHLRRASIIPSLSLMLDGAGGTPACLASASFACRYQVRLGSCSLRCNKRVNRVRCGAVICHCGVCHLSAKRTGSRQA
jgi:hypothetical protein